MKQNTKDISFYKSITDGNGNILFPYGLLSAGSVYDEVTENKAIKRVGVVDLGDLDYTYRTLETDFLSSEFDKFPKQGGSSINPIYTNSQASTPQTQSDKSVRFTATGKIIIKNSEYTDAADFKSAMSGVMLYYELAEPVEVAIDTQNMAYNVDGGGTEMLLPENTSAPTTSPAMMDVAYGLDAMGTLKNLQKNYLAQTDLDRLLTAMGTALGFTYTKTWDATNKQWNFTITPNNNG